MGFNMQPSGVTSQGTFSPDELLAQDAPDLVAVPVVIKSGSGVLVRGTVLEVSATPGKYRAVTVDADAKLILAEDVDATSADKTTVAYRQGSFNAGKVTLGAGATLAGVKASLDVRSIFLVDTIAG